MVDDNRCRAMTVDGQQCICLRAENTYVDQDQRTKCRDCDHIASAHPKAKPSIGSFFKGFQDAAQGSSSSSSSKSVKVSREEAIAETSAGLRNVKKRKSDSNSDTTLKKAKKVNAGKEKSLQMSYGTVIFLPWGAADGQLPVRHNKTPSADELQELQKAKLVVFASPDRPLVIDSSWTNAEANTEVQALFPEALQFLFHKYPNERQLWLGATVYKTKLTVATDSLLTGVELSRYCRVLGRTARDRVLYLVSQYRIPSHQWEWKEPDSEDLGSDIDSVSSEPIVFTPPKPKPAYKGKGKAKATDVKMEPEIDPKSAEDEPETDMRHAAKMRTRLASGVIKKKTVSIPGSDDGEPEVVVVSDGEANNLRPLTAADDEDLPSLFMPGDRSPSPPIFYEDLLLPPPTGSSSSGNAAFTATFSTWTPTFSASTNAPAVPPATPAAPALAVPPPPPATALALAAPAAPAALHTIHRFSRMGRGGRGD
ncbi:hypothetical protein MSAN_01027700 [Mycena sanguinolenta]|uniref:Uncharacterized protein n=1 Tax=Mycena sanguinolenta TaxID=230812 RepID=A0A8H7D6Z6_9AGAR|nr:hypothetical protein MSAN_01027700 [Mycena sanguinolenta]